MCIECWREMDSPKIDTPSVRAAALAIEHLYQQDGCGAGGYLHVVIDDDNLDCVASSRRSFDSNEYGFTFTPEAWAAQKACFEAIEPLTEDELASAIAICSGFWAPPGYVVKHYPWPAIVPTARA